MAEQHDVAVFGLKLDEETVQKIFGKAKPAEGFTFFRKDSLDSLIALDEYGKRTEYGWEIAPIRPVANGGTHDLNNLRPIHWKNNKDSRQSLPDGTLTKKT